MRIGGISSALYNINQVSSNPTVKATSLKMLDNAIESNEDMGAQLAKMMEQSVTPYIGGNFDISI